MKKTIVLSVLALAALLSFSAYTYTHIKPLQQTTVKGNWKYKVKEDKMTDEKIYAATTEAPEKLHFGFPYAGGTTMSLDLTSFTSDGTNYIGIIINNGKFSGTPKDTSEIRIRFDKNPPEKCKFLLIGDDGDMGALFPYKDLIDKIKKAKKFLVELEFKNEGTHQVEFNVEGLEWNH
jgi:hypothetical protein